MSRRGAVGGAAGGLLLGGGVAPGTTGPALAGDVSDNPYFEVETTLPKAYVTAQRTEANEILLEQLNLKVVGRLPYERFLRVAFHDVATYDRAAKTGGLNGSIRFELDRPENKALVPAFELLAECKKAVDAKLNCEAGISWSDLIATAAKSTTKNGWNDLLATKASKDLDDAGRAAWVNTYGNPFFPPRLCRTDAAEADASGLVPVMGTSSVADFKAAAARWGLTPRELVLLHEMFGGDAPEATLEFLAQDDELKPFVEATIKAQREFSRSSYEVPASDTIVKLFNRASGFNDKQYAYRVLKPGREA